MPMMKLHVTSITLMLTLGSDAPKCKDLYLARTLRWTRTSRRGPANAFLLTVKIIDAKYNVTTIYSRTERAAPGQRAVRPVQTSDRN